MSDYLPCLKRQNENYKGVERKRCLERESKFYREVVSPEACHACPVRKIVEEIKKCSGVQSPIEKQPVNPGNKSIPVQLPIINNPGGVYPNCVYRACDPDNCKCSITNLPVNPEICNRCDAEVREHTAGVLDSFQNYFGALREWIAHGRPVRTDKEVAALFNDHCSKCDKYDPIKKACLVCGCQVNADSAAVFNKLKMKTEHCPIGRF